MFDALWTLRLRWRLWLGTTGLLLFFVAGPIWWQTPPPTYQAATTIVVDGKGKGMLLGRLNSALLARQAGLQGGETGRAAGLTNSELVQVTGTAPTPGRAVAVANGLVATLQAQFDQEAGHQRAVAEVGVTLTRQRLLTEVAKVEAALRQLPPPNGHPTPPAGGTVVIVGEGRRDVVRLALETRYLELTKTLAAWTPPASGVVPAITVLDPAVTATAVAPPFAPLRAAAVASLVLGLMVTWVREWWTRELAQRRGGDL